MAKKEVRDKVVAFRVTEALWNELTAKVKNAKITGAHTPGLMARKLMIDWHEEAVTWKSKKRKDMSPESFKAAQQLAASAA